jgi:hypothetical protein
MEDPAFDPLYPRLEAIQPRRCQTIQYHQEENHVNISLANSPMPWLMIPSELSFGFFSASNHKKLLGEDTDIPVFEAKMERDTRLVYTIDCVMDNSGKVGPDLGLHI